MFAAIICLVIIITMFLFICLLWEIGDLMRVNNILRDNERAILESNDDLEAKNKEMQKLVDFYKEDNEKAHRANQSLSAQLIKVINEVNAKRMGNIDNNEGD